MGPMFRSVAAAEAALGRHWRWPHFRVGELACRCGGRFCGGEYWHDDAFLDGLEALRAAMGQPLVITSGHRCGQWNAAVGGAALSQHKQIAVDIAVAGHDRARLLSGARALGFTGLGLGRRFLHLDRRAVPAVWDYHGSAKQWQI